MIKKKEFMKKWVHLKTPEERYDAAVELFKTVRGMYIISQALVLAIEHMEEREAILQEPSNMADMGLLTEIFSMYSSLEEFKRGLPEDGRDNPQV